MPALVSRAFQHMMNVLVTYPFYLLEQILFRRFLHIINPLGHVELEKNWILSDVWTWNFGLAKFVSNFLTGLGEPVKISNFS